MRLGQLEAAESSLTNLPLSQKALLLAKVCYFNGPEFIALYDIRKQAKSTIIYLKRIAVDYIMLSLGRLGCPPTLYTTLPIN